jgi:tetratricopeptide (TPR) repeat protein
VVAAGGPDKPLGVERLQVPLVQSAGEPIDLSFRLDANKILTVRAELANHPEAHCMVLLENPLCAVAFGSPRQREIAELEDELARRAAAAYTLLDRAKHDRLVRLYEEEGRYERAIDEARRVLEADGRPSVPLLNRTASCYERLGALDRAEKHYREVVRLEPGWGGARFNLSLLLERRGRVEEALALMDEAVRLEPAEGGYRGWRAILLQRRGRLAEAQAELRRAAEALDALPSLDSWHRFWRGEVAEALGDAVTAARLAREASQQPPVASAPGYDASRLPGHSGALARRVS